MRTLKGSKNWVQMELGGWTWVLKQTDWNYIKPSREWLIVGNALGQTEKCTGFVQMSWKTDTGVIGNTRLR